MGLIESLVTSLKSESDDAATLPPSPRSLSPNAPAYNTPAAAGDGQHGPDLPPGAGKLGMWLFLAALFMLFAASLLAYILIRHIGSHAPARGTIHLPHILWGSTAAMLASSVTIHLALSHIRKGKTNSFRNMMIATLSMASLFIFMQLPGMVDLLNQHGRMAEQKIHIYGMVFVLVLLHAMHILGGLLPLMIATLKSIKNLYTPQDHNGIVYLAMYWHFLDAVWIAMFVTFLVLA